MNFKKKIIIKLIILAVMFIIYQLWTVKIIYLIKEFIKSPGQFIAI